MKLVKYLKENWLSWIFSIILAFSIIFNDEVSTASKNSFLKYSTQILPVVIVVLSIIFLSNLYAIDENLWDDFKKGRDIHIDRMMKNIRTTFILILVSIVFWLCLIIYNLSNLFQIDYLKSSLLILTPILIVFSTSKEYYSLQKEYYN